MFDNVEFFNYSSNQKEKLIQRHYIHDFIDIPGSLIERDAVYIPNKPALYRRDGSRIDQSAAIYIPASHVFNERKRERVESKICRTFPKLVDIPETLQLVDEPVLFLGSIPMHYGHFLLEGMSRLYAHTKGEKRKIIFTSSNFPIETMLLVPYVAEIFRLLGIKPADVLIVEQPTRFREVEIVLPSINHAYEIHHTLKTPHARASQNVPTKAGPSFDGPVYLTRSGLGPKRRKIEGELALENILTAHNFMIVRPELLTVADQIRLFRECPIIVGASGSALHTCLFEMDKDIGKRIILDGPDVNGRFVMIDEIMQSHHRSYYVNVLGIDNKERKEDGSIKEISMNLDMAVSIIRSLI